MNQAFPPPVTAAQIAPMIVRGTVIEDDLVEVGGRGDGIVYRTPDWNRHGAKLPLASPGLLADLYTLSFEDILDYLEELGARLDPAINPLMREACAGSYATSPLTPPIVDFAYAAIPALFRREHVREMAETAIGIPYLEGWVVKEVDGLKLGTRCFGARTLHIIAGNAPMIAALTVIRNAILRSDAIIKTPSNDPFTAPAIARTMIEMAPGHPITKHLSVAYWRGGDEDFEQRLYQPHHIEKIQAWGGFASVKHVTKYIQPGLELVSLDPKRSTSIVGADAFDGGELQADAACRLARDIGAMNQQGCVNARVVYAQSGTDEDGIARLRGFAQEVYDQIQQLPPEVSTSAKAYDRALRAEVDALALDDAWYSVIGGGDAGAVIVSHMAEPVDFATSLNDRTANLVPIDDIAEAIEAVDAYTQTVGVYPESLKDELLDVLPLYGAQRFVTLGHAVNATLVSAQDGIEPMRRMGKWIINEIRD